MTVRARIHTATATSTTPRETKPFYLTSEFYVAVVLPWLLTVLQNTDLVSLVPQRYGWILPLITVLVSGMYAQARGRAKSGVPYVDTAPVVGE